MLFDNEIDFDFVDLLALHLNVLIDLLNGKSFHEIKTARAAEFEEMNYLEVAVPSLLTFEGNELVGAYPVSPKPTKYKVEIEGVGTGYSMCAIDALGIAFTFNKPTKVFATTQDTNEPVEFFITPDMDELPQTEYVVTYQAIDHSITNIALQQCPQINFFRDRENVPGGLQILDLNSAFKAAKAQFSQEAILSCLKGKPTCDC